MDRHDVSGVTAKGAAEAHGKDLEIQEEYGCNCMTYWVDEDRENVFCLIDAPDIKAVKDMHRRAHGLIPHAIVEVDSNLVKAFLGRIHDPVHSKRNRVTEISIFNDPAFRSLLVADLKDKALFACKYGRERSHELIKKFNHLMEQAAKSFKGSTVEKYNEFLISFTSVTNAVDCAIKLQELIKSQNLHKDLPKVELQIGITAGVPLTDSNNLFGDAVEMARSLRFIAHSSHIKTTAIIKDLYKGRAPQLFDDYQQIRTLNKNEEHFLHSLINVIHQALSDNNFNITQFSKQIGVSKSQLYRKTVNLTGLSPNDFFHEIRLDKAVKLMYFQNKSIAETSYLLGFASPSYFTKCFKKRFNVLPVDFCKSIA